jgi:hypothetical protein
MGSFYFNVVYNSLFPELPSPNPYVFEKNLGNVDVEFKYFFLPSYLSRFFFFISLKPMHVEFIMTLFYFNYSFYYNYLRVLYALSPSSSVVVFLHSSSCYFLLNVVLLKISLRFLRGLKKLFELWDCILD